MNLIREIETMSTEMEKELRGNILPYWMTYTPDRIHGGFFGHIDANNRPDKTAPKGAVLNARILWTFSSAYRHFGDTAYLEMADRAYDYIRKRFIDHEFGGIYWELDYKGRPRNNRKQIYGLAFALYALTEYHKACGNQEALQMAKDLFETIETKSFDKQRNGYTEALGRNWAPLKDFRLSLKDANESKTMNTHLHILEAYTNLYRIWKEPELGEALKNVILLFAERFIDTGSYHVKMFFDDDWNLKSDLVSYGHDIETSWLLTEAAEVLDNDALSELIKPISINIARTSFSALDRDHGLVNESFPSKKETDMDKHWWHQAEAIVGYYNAWELTGEEEFAQKAIYSWDFTKKHIIDHEGGEWFWKVSKDGRPYPEDEKAGFWKCPYHNSRACIEIMNRSKILVS